MVKDEIVGSSGGIFQGTGKSFGPTPVYWHGFRENNKGKLVPFPRFVIAK